MSIIFHSLKQRKYLIQAAIFFVSFLGIYFVLDYLNMSYKEMANEFGVFLVIVNIVLNILMALLSSILLVGSEIMVKSTKSSSLGFFAVIFGIFTYGCTTCVITFLANLGIVFSVIALPYAGLPYKFISLALIILGFLLTARQLKRGCKIKINVDKQETQVTE